MKKSFKNLFAVLCVAITATTANIAFAELNFYGQIKSVTPESINLDNKGVTIIIPLNSETKIESEIHKGPFEYEQKISMKDLKVGDWVEVKTELQGKPPKYVAEQIEVKSDEK